MNSSFGLSYKLPFELSICHSSTRTSCRIWCCFLISVEIIFLPLYWGIFPEFPLPAPSEYTWFLGLWAGLGGGGGKLPCLPASPLVGVSASSGDMLPPIQSPSFSLTFLQSPGAAAGGCQPAALMGDSSLKGDPAAPVPVRVHGIVDVFLAASWGHLTQQWC